MHCSRTLLTVSFLVISFSMWAQEADHHDSALLARLSYERSTVVWKAGEQNVCVAVTRDGEYRIVRALDDGQTQRLRGKMPKDQLQQLAQLLGAAKFRALSGDHGGLIRQDAEVFAAEIPGLDAGARGRNAEVDRTGCLAAAVVECRRRKSVPGVGRQGG